MHRKACWLVLLLLITLFIACDDPKNTLPIQNANKKDPINSPDELAQLYPFLTSDDARVALQEIINQGYRLAQKEDYKIADATYQAKDDVAMAVTRPYYTGDINQDRNIIDFAVVLINTKKTDANKFNVVIFNQPKDLNDNYKPYWLYKDIDLSHHVLGWREAGLVIDEIQVDGNRNPCFVNWDKTKESYNCEAKRVIPAGEPLRDPGSLKKPDATPEPAK